VEVAKHTHPDHANACLPSHVACGHRFGHERGWPDGADRRRQQEVALDIPQVSIARLGAALDPGREPVEGRGDRLGADQRIGMIGVLGDEPRDRAGGLLHMVGSVPEHIDGTGSKVR
jgi:hypothetical protein